MRFKYLFRSFVLIAMLLGVMGGSQQVQARAGSENVRAVEIIMRSLTYWDAVYSGNVNSNRYEKWPLSFADSHIFSVSASPTNGNLTPLLLLLDVNGNELSRSVGTLTSSQPAGNYYVQVQPEAGSGSYSMTIREMVTTVTTVLDPPNFVVGGTSAANVSLNDVPASGYTAAEFTCTYDPALVEVSGITANTDLFGADAVTAVNGPSNGKFIVAIAGSNGHKAVANGAAFTFNLKGLQVGETSIECTARVSVGDNTLTGIPSAGAAPIMVTPPISTDGTLTGKVTASKPVTISLLAEGATPITASANPDGTFSIKAPAGNYVVVAESEGFLNAQGAVTIVVDKTTHMEDVTLPGGDIDGNDVIDQFDAMTIGMSYNTAIPPAADLNNDGTINVLDLEIVASNYRKAGALEWKALAIP